MFKDFYCKRGLKEIIVLYEYVNFLLKYLKIFQQNLFGIELFYIFYFFIKNKIMVSIEGMYKKNFICFLLKLEK